MNYNYKIINGTSFPSTDVNSNKLFSNSDAFFLGSSFSEIRTLKQIHFDFIKAIPLRQKTIHFGHATSRMDRRTIVTCKL